MNPKEFQEMFEQIQQDFHPHVFRPNIDSFERSMIDVQNRMKDIERQMESIARQSEEQFAKARRGNPRPSTQRVPFYPKPTRADKPADPEPIDKVQKIKKQEEEQADKERRAKIPGGFDIWDD